ncbi:MAG: DUF6089 family protein [Vicingaceae bacterium]
MRKLKLLILSIFILLAYSIQAQKTAELGVLLGRSYYLGELNPDTHYGNETGSLTYGAVFRYNLNMRYSLKATLSQTTLQAEDINNDLLFNQARKAEFENQITELATSIEFNFLPYVMGDKERFFSPYLFVGLNLFRSSPETFINGVELEGETVDDKTLMAYSFGPGFKLNLGSRFSLAFEWGFRKTGNDHIDGLPNFINDTYELGKDYDNDWFVSSIFMLTYRITDLGVCPAYNNF